MSLIFLTISSKKTTEYFYLFLMAQDERYVLNIFGDDPICHCPGNRYDPFT